MMKRAHLAAITLAALAALPSEATIFETNDQQRANLKTVSDWSAAEAARVAGSADLASGRAWTLDRKAGELVALAEFCGIAPSATIEFPVIGEASDRDYEALFRTFAKPGEIAAALESLGLPRGRNVDTAAASFWPCGEPVTVEVAPFAATNTAFVPIQRYIADMQTRAPLAFDSFVYCGSVDDPDGGPGARLCDTMAPNSVLSTYNEGQTVLDMPVHCGQSDVYERFLLSPDSDLVPFGLYKVRFRPKRRADGRRTVRELTLAFDKEGTNVVYRLGEGGSAKTFAEPAGLLDALRADVEAGFAVFTSLEFGDGLTVEEAAAQCRMVSSIEGDKGIRVAPPAPDTIFYKGFLPSSAWRKAEGRPSQPWEIHFAAPNATNAPAIRLVQTIEDWTSTDSLDPLLSTKEFTASTPDEAAAILANRDVNLKAGKDASGATRPRIPVLLAFAPRGSTLGLFMPTLRRLRDRYPTIYVFTE